MENEDYMEDPVILNNQIRRLSVQLLKCQIRRRQSTGSAISPDINGRIDFQNLLLNRENVREEEAETQSACLSCWRNTCAAFSAIICGCFIAIECACVLAGIVFFHVWFITPYNIICYILDLKRRCLLSVYDRFLRRYEDRLSKMSRLLTYIKQGERNDET